ncbi:oxygen-dependent coproporphyrinogen oxidase [Rhodovulum tesquicola]|uniref:oxygen-dependent coproporphyrinogen oxidase n=1 Tax=Rhodovulum tesquicola TaxID=540254 RepID=UPI0020981D54|nr:oxygen-dependent coproporphyrinogen oxidase [Rhodovulum tesquicola]MCO8146138.1 oxygen-dependent coproporphyrinogen oxidase [Rhodovulum tesquicola]
MSEQFDEHKMRAAAWFRAVRDEIVAAFEALEDAQATGPLRDAPPGRFEVSETRRQSEDGSDAGGGLMSVMRGGRVFEKVGVAVSTVHGRLNRRAQAAMMARKDLPGMADDPRFWASGISLVAHMQNPHTPAVHLNTRMFWTPHGWWFGGGTDLNPCLPHDEDTADFHAVLRAACGRHDPAYYPRFKAWADEYFFVPHRGRARGVGGIFYDDLNSGDWEADFAFTREVGRAFLPAFLPLVERRRDMPWSEADRAAQLAHRGLYAEYNLLYDRGTKFGLETGHDPEAVLMTMPPLATWP